MRLRDWLPTAALTSLSKKSHDTLLSSPCPFLKDFPCPVWKRRLRQDEKLLAQSTPRMSSIQPLPRLQAPHCNPLPAVNCGSSLTTRYLFTYKCIDTRKRMRKTCRTCLLLLARHFRAFSNRPLNSNRLQYAEALHLEQPSKYEAQCP